MKNLPFICQREQTAYPNDSCHVACLMMLLKYCQITPLPTYGELCERLGLSQTLLEGDYDFCLENLFRYLVERKIPFRMHFLDHGWGQALEQAPIMVAMFGGRRFWGSGGHTIILISYEQESFTYLDPWFAQSTGKHIRTLAFKDFKKHYSGIACQLLLTPSL